MVLSEAHLGLVELRQGILAVAEIAADTFVEKLEALEQFQLFVLDFVVALHQVEHQVDQEHRVVDILVVVVEDMGYTLNWALTIAVQHEAGTEH